MQCFVTVQTEETPPLQVYILHAYRAAESLVIASWAMGIESRLGTLYTCFWVFLVLSEVFFVYLAAVGQDRSLSMGATSA